MTAMLSLVTRPSLLGTKKLVKFAFKSSTVRSFSVGDTFRKKEKVEEDRFVREQERKLIEKMKAEAAANKAISEKEMMKPVMEEASAVLDNTGDEVSDAGLEALAQWKIQP